MPILGVIASGISGHLTQPDAGAMFPLGMVRVGSGGAANITFSSIPSTYKHLQIRSISRTNHSSGTDGDYLKITFNNDTSANYANHSLRGNGSSAYALGFSSQNAGWIGRSGATGLSANIFGALVTDVLDYTSTSKAKTVRNLGGYDGNGSGIVELDSALWFATPAAITSIKLESGSGTAFEQYSTFALYGIKGA
jgi:hypothetical protein